MINLNKKLKETFTFTTIQAIFKKQIYSKFLWITERKRNAHNIKINF